MPQGDLPIDKSWAWVIAFASAGLNLIHGGTHAIFGLLKLEAEYAYNEEECPQDISLWMLSAASTLMLLAGAAVTPLLTRFTHRSVGICASLLAAVGLILTAIAPNCYFMFFSFSTVYAAGTGALDMIAVTVFAQYFNKHRALAVGIVGAGAGIGGIVCPQLVIYLFRNYTFCNALICYSGLYLNAIILCALLRPASYYNNAIKDQLGMSKSANHEIEMDETKACQEERTPKSFTTEVLVKPNQRLYNWRLWYQPTALILAVTLFFAENGKGLITTVTPSYGEEFGVAGSTTAVVISATYACQIATRILNGWFADRKIIPALLQFAMIFVFSCASGLVAALVPGLLGVCTLYVVISLFGTSIISLQPIVIIDLVGVENIETMSGITNVYGAASFVSSTFIANALHAEYRTWISVYYFIAGCFLISSLTGNGLYIYQRLSQRGQDQAQV